MERFIPLFVLLPLFGFVISALLPHKKERVLSGFVFFNIGLQLLGLLVFIPNWILQDHQFLTTPDVLVYSNSDYAFYLSFTFDKVTAIYSVTGAFLAFLVSTYSRVYLHREKGYKRFFVSLLFFFLGYNMAVFSGNFETLFIGWEILGISSFLLIAFYRNRYLPVKNALKVFTIYRIGDVGLLLAMWMSHHLFHHNIRFSELANDVLVVTHLQNQSLTGIFISAAILITAATKSAQLPFSSWLPRAMEGPTPSSAIFYGSLSVHLGAFLLLRTFPFWEHQMSIRIAIIVIGLGTSFVSSMIARVQSSIKSQIAYASSAQIGLIFVEIALGFDVLALIHFAGNAFLRTYQLLVSPSVVSYLIREQFYSFKKRPDTIEDSLPKKIANTFYLLSLKEWNLDAVVAKFFWNPLKTIGKKIPIHKNKTFLYILIPSFIIGIFLFMKEDLLPVYIFHKVPLLFSGIALTLVLRSFVERKDVFLSWSLIIANHFLIALALSFNEHYSMRENLIYLSGIFVAGAVGYVLLYLLKKKESNFDLVQFQGHAYEHPRLALLFLLTALGLAGFPISPTFIGEDLIFRHIHQNQLLLAFFVALSFILNGLSLLRIYARLFLGPHQKPYHEIPYKSS